MARPSSKLVGDSGEELAALYLEEIGYKIITRNYRTRLGEIDIIAKDEGVLVFVEVKKKKNSAYGTPAEMITPKKIHKITRVAEQYVQDKNYHKKWRLDAVLILGEEIELRKNLTV